VGSDPNRFMDLTVVILLGGRSDVFELSLQVQSQNLFLGHADASGSLRSVASGVPISTEHPVHSIRARFAALIWRQYPRRAGSGEIALSRISTSKVGPS